MDGILCGWLGACVDLSYRLEARREESRMPLSRTPLAALLPACFPLLGHCREITSWTVGRAAPIWLLLDCQPRESLQGIQSRFAAYACMDKLGALRGLRALHRLRRVSCVGVTAYRESPSSWPVGLSGGRVEWKCRVVAVVRFAMPLSRRGSGCVRLIAA